MLFMGGSNDPDARPDGEVAPSFEGEDNVIRAVFDEGPLGLKFNQQCEILLIKRGTQSDTVDGLTKDDLLIAVNDTAVQGFTLNQATLTFQKHVNWLRGENGLPAYDSQMLQSMFQNYGKEIGETEAKRYGVNATELAEFMREIHNLAVVYKGRDPDPLPDAICHAEKLIETYDENGDGLLDYAEVVAWVESIVQMCAEERKAFAARGGFCLDSARFVEDICMGLHVPPGTGKTVQEDDNGTEERPETRPDEPGEEGEEGEEDQESASTGPKKPEKNKRIKIAELLVADANDGIDRPKVRLTSLTRRALTALGSGPAQSFLELGRDLICVAMRSLIDANDNVLRAAVIERALSCPAPQRAAVDPTDGEKERRGRRREKLRPWPMNCEERILILTSCSMESNAHLNRQRAVILCEM